MKRRAFSDHPQLPLPHSDSERSSRLWDQFFTRIEAAKTKQRRRRG